MLLTSPPVGHLAQLVSERREQLGMSYRDIASAAGVSHNAVHLIVTGRTKRVPSERVLRGLSVALHMDYETLTAAVAADLGMVERRVDDGLADLIYLSAQELSPVQKRALLALVRSMLEQQRATGDDDVNPQ
jgi:transcriptional regulator with XRE-family HTH domain